MHFDFEGRNFDTPTVESAVSWREQALVSMFGHILLVLLVLFVPRLEFFQNLQEQRLERLAEIAEQRQQQQLALAARERENFVFIAPRPEAELPEAPRPGAPLSDRDRVAQSPLRTPDPANRLPVAEGTTSEFAVLDNADVDPDLLAPRDLEGNIEDPEDADETVSEEEDEDEGELSDGRLADATLGHGEEEEAPDAPSDTPGVPEEDLPGSERFADSSLSQPEPDGVTRMTPDFVLIYVRMACWATRRGASRGVSSGRPSATSVATPADTEMLSNSTPRASTLVRGSAGFGPRSIETGSCRIGRIPIVDTSY